MKRLCFPLIVFLLSMYKVEVARSSNDHKIMVALNGEISVIDPDGSNYTVVTNDVHYPVSMDYDAIHGYVYYIDSGNINRFQYPATGNITAETIISNNSDALPSRIAVDGLHGNILWSDRNNYTIQRSSIDGSGAITVIETDGFVFSLSIDSEDEWLYFIDGRSGIQKCRLNGNDNHTIMSGYYCLDLAIESAGSTIYCGMDWGIGKTSLDGENITMLNHIWNDKIDEFNGILYHTRYFGTNLYSIDFGSSTYNSVWTAPTFIYDIVVVEQISSLGCRNYLETDKMEKRSSDYLTDLSVDKPISDHMISEGWYRHHSRNGDRMPTTPPGVHHCGTLHPIWLNGELPTLEEGNVTREACVQTDDSTCQATLHLEISMCGSFYVYYLLPTPENASYCFGSGDVACPNRMSSETGYFPGCSSSYPKVSVTTAVHPDLIEGESYPIPNIPLTPSLESVFTCRFDIITPELFVYDVIWYINGNEVKKNMNVLPENINSTVLRNSDWVDNYQMNMEVSCALRLRDSVNSVPGPYLRSAKFEAGLFPGKLEYTVIEGQSINIPFRATVPIGCIASHKNMTQHCTQNLYLHQPDKANVQSVCVNNIANKDIVFKAEFCGIKLSTNDWKDDKYLEVFGFSDGLYNTHGRSTLIRINTAALSSMNTHWKNIQIPDIKVIVVDKDASLTNRLCQSSNDPHISTYDGKYYHFMEIGEFVMYRNDKGPYWVHALLTNCGFGWAGSACHCGIAVRSRQSLFVLRTCKTISRTKKELLPNPITNVKMCDENDLLIESSNNRYKIKLPIGTEIILSISRWSGFIGTVTIKPSIYDIGEAKGLCGFPSITKDASDDYMHRNNGPINDDQAFANSWRVTSSHEQIFVEEPTFFNDYVVDLNNGGHQSLQSDTYCTCEDQASSTQDLADYNTVHCNLTESTEYCSLDSTSTTGSVITSQYKACQSSRRRRRSTVEHSDDQNEFIPLEIDDDVTVTPEPRTFRDGWTNDTAYKTCKEQLEEAMPAYTYDGYMELSMDNFIASCVKDIELTGDTSFMSDTVDAIIVNVITELSRNESLYVSNSTESGGQTILDEITSRLCSNNCSSNGRCVQGSCSCHSGYIGDDCSVKTSAPPQNISVPVAGLCRLGERTCKKTNLYGNFLSENVWYRIRQFKVEGNKIQDITDWVSHKAEYRNMFLVTIDLHRSWSKRSANEESVPKGYDISLSYDGQNYGEYVSIIVYNEDCFSCTSSSSCISLGNCDIQKDGHSANGKSNTVPVTIGVSCGILFVICITIGILIYKLKYTDPKSKVDVGDKRLKNDETKHQLRTENTISDIQFEFNEILFYSEEKVDRQLPPKSFWKQRDEFSL